MRATLLILLGAAVALEVGFLAGQTLHKNTMMAVCLGLITFLTFLVYAYILLAGMASYSRELKEKSGYLVFMVPVRPIGVVLSKLVFTALAALAATAVFGAVAYFDFRYLIGKMNIDPDVMNQINMLLRFGLNANADLLQIVRIVMYYVCTVLIEVLLTMCTAYLAITLSATMLQNKKGFVRAIISLLLFVGLTWGCSWVAQKLIYANATIDKDLKQLSGYVGWSLLLNAGFCAVFTGASAWLLDKKVNL
jgi:hypothetical protein